MDSHSWLFGKRFLKDEDVLALQGKQLTESILVDKCVLQLSFQVEIRILEHGIGHVT
jgi:hypothetical protein